MRALPREQHAVIVFLILQALFWHGVPPLWPGTKTMKPDLGIVPDVPGPGMVEAFSLGEKQFYFRLAAFQIQNAGDTFGRHTALKDYDYGKLYKWWTLLDSLDARSDLVPTLVSSYFGATQNPRGQTPYVVDYLERHADRDPERKWWWYAQAIYHAKHRLNDNGRALEIARKLAALPPDSPVPIWTRQMEAFILEDEGEYAQACEIILHVLDTYKNLPESEIAFMLHFIKERIKAMKDAPQEDMDPRCKPLYEDK